MLPNILQDTSLPCPAHGKEPPAHNAEVKKMSLEVEGRPPSPLSAFCCLKPPIPPFPQGAMKFKGQGEGPTSPFAPG